MERALLAGDPAEAKAQRWNVEVGEHTGCLKRE